MTFQGFSRTNEIQPNRREILPSGCVMHANACRHLFIMIELLMEVVDGRDSQGVTQSRLRNCVENICRIFSRKSRGNFLFE